jgi:hypothetical protein
VADLGDRLDYHNDGKMYRLYVNGVLFHTLAQDKFNWLDNRWTLGEKFTIGNDPWGYDVEMLFGAAQLRDEVMSEADIRALGGAKYYGFQSVPEPASMTVLALGALGVLARRRRK